MKKLINSVTNVFTTMANLKFSGLALVSVTQLVPVVLWMRHLDTLEWFISYTVVSTLISMVLVLLIRNIKFFANQGLLSWKKQLVFTRNSSVLGLLSFGTVMLITPDWVSQHLVIASIFVALTVISMASSLTVSQLMLNKAKA